MKPTARLRTLIADDSILIIPVVHDPLCARIAERAGFSAIFSGGYANSAALLGRPDVGLLTLSEMVDCASRIVDATTIPVFADGDTGYGNTTNVARTVSLYEKAGVAGVFIEDQVSPKRCGHMEGKAIISPEEMVAKVRAAVDARKDPDLVIMARTDAIAVNGIEDAIHRANLYYETGADMTFVEAPTSVEQMRRICHEVKGPAFANMLPGGKTPVLSAAELEAIGYAVVADPVSCTYAIARAVSTVFSELKRTGDPSSYPNLLMGFDEFNSLVGLQEIRDREQSYLGRCL